MTDLRPGLRERKRLATHRAIQLAVLSLVGEKGLDRVTVEEISDRADVSPRTFFNYFPSKEAAALGDIPSLPEDEVQARFLSSTAPLLHDVAGLFSSALQESDDQVDLLRLRKDILRQHPQLFAMRMASMRSFEDDLADLIARRVAGAGARPTEADVEAGRLIALVSMAAVRHGWASWAEAEERAPLAERVSDSFQALGGLFAKGGALASSTPAEAG